MTTSLELIALTTASLGQTSIPPPPQLPTYPFRLTLDTHPAASLPPSPFFVMSDTELKASLTAGSDAVAEFTSKPPGFCFYLGEGSCGSQRRACLQLESRWSGVPEYPASAEGQSFPRAASTF